MLEVALYLSGVWGIAMTVLLTPKSFYVNSFDRLTQAKYRKDRTNLQIMLDHLRSYPEQWSITRDAVSFPLESKAKQIYLNKGKNGWTYSLSAFGNESRPLNGHFAHEFVAAIEEQNNTREKKALLRQFYPDLNEGTLRLS